MPFESEAQRRWMHANKPEMAKEWEEKMKDEGLPEKKAMEVAFFDELEKIAASKAKRPKDPSLGAGAATYFGSQLGAGAAGLAAKPLAKTMKGSSTKVTPQMAESLMKSMKLDPKTVSLGESLPYEAQYRPVPSGGKITHVVQAPKTRAPEILAHELGHASMRRGVPSTVLWGLGRTVAPSLGLMAGSVMAAQDPESTAAKWAPAAVAGGFAPTLIDEALASGKALRAIRQAGMKGKEFRQALGTLGKGFGTYGLVAGGAAAVPYLVRKYRLAQQEEET